MFAVETPLPELVGRGALLFIGFIILFRVLPRRSGGELEAMDLVYLLLITEAASHALGDYSSITDGAVQIGTFVALNYMFNKLSYHYPAFRRLVEQRPLRIVTDGKVDHAHMRSEALTMDELLSNLRLQGVESVEAVKLAHVESDGRISVIKMQS